MSMKLLGIIRVGSIIKDLLLMRFSTLASTTEIWEYNGTVHQLFIDFKKAYDSVKREVLYNILLEFGIPKKLVGLM
jgi:negative regulator of genetic competence, sporulation and motility